MPNKPFRFWKVLKPRNATRVITAYAGAAVEILECEGVSREDIY